MPCFSPFDILSFRPLYPCTEEDMTCRYLPLAAWLIKALQPRQLVALGCEQEQLYFSFCQSVAETGLDTRCYAVMTSNEFGQQSSPSSLAGFNRKQYGRFSTILFEPPTSAAHHFVPESVDLICFRTIGSEDDARQLFAQWQSKLSSGAVVLFVESKAGPWRKIWRELSQLHEDHIDFHEKGWLGILQLPAASNKQRIDFRASECKLSFDKFFSELGALTSELSVLRAASNNYIEQIEQLNQTLAQCEARVDAYEHSRSWQLTAPLRTGGARLKAGHRIGQKICNILREQGGLLAVAAKAQKLLVEQGWREAWSRSRRMLSTAIHAPTLPSVGAADAQRDYAEWVRCFDTLDEAKRSRIHSKVAVLNNPPKISVVMPVYDPNPAWLSEAIESVRGQIYPHWELCIADDCSPNAQIRELLNHYASADHRIKVVYRTQNGHISAASNSALELATGEWIALLDHDDLLPEHALAYIALAIAEHPDAGLIYSDEDKIDEQGQRFNPYFKCDWNPELFRSQNMISHLGAYRRALVDQLGGFRIGFEGSQDYDLALRCVEQLDASQIVHVPRVLYHWRMHAQSTALVADVKGYAQQAGKTALEEHLARLDIQGRVELTPFLQYRVRYTIPDEHPSIGIIIPSKNAVPLLRQCIESILTKTTYKNYEILVVDNGSDESEAIAYLDELKSQPKIKVIHDHREFNYSALNNNAVSFVPTEFICLLNNDIEVITDSWLEEMVSLAIQPGVGAIGAKLLYPNQTMQHGGVITGLLGVAGHAHRHLDRHHGGYFGRAALLQSLSAVTAACMLIRRSIFMDVGGLNETDLAIAFNDIDFCLRVREAGYRNIWTPFAELYHHESASRGYEDTPEKQARFKREVDFMRKRWGNLLQNDPAYNPNLTLEREDFSQAWPPRVSI
jgi:GT2 family glycosyltransferase